LPASFVGRDYDDSFLRDLPTSADPCGERGEFHSFVYDGPVFTEPVSFAHGCTIVREDRFCYRDLVPTTGRDTAFSI
jgi:diphthamide synthase (EF-2-diphthine--ammonia ligase)